MSEERIAKYNLLNQLAEAWGTVIFGGSSDVEIPLGELKQAFALNERIYNRSFPELSAADAARLYGDCVAELCPDTVLVHVGEADVIGFAGKETAFGTSFRRMIDTIKDKNKGCRIVIVSLKNYENDSAVTRINELLKELAAAENCEFQDIAEKRTWNPTESSKTASFLHDLGFDSALHIPRSIYDLVRILFCYEG